MKPVLRFDRMELDMGGPGRAAGVPDLVGNPVLQNNLEFHLSEEDEIYEGYGRRRSTFPYRQFNTYSRKLTRQQADTAVLENDYLKAVFLPQLGGRLWSLYDKLTGRNLLYTNDVIRYSNLASRNAWFSGGVEWNIGIIGHSPFTVCPLFTAVLEDEEYGPVLRMYEYERIRGVTFQMDFWLGDTDRFLNARMRIVNGGEDVVPMYWWSNMAVPAYEDGRIVVPARQAYTFREGGVYKVDIPYLEGIDISHYSQIPLSVDYFFEIPGSQPKYIAHMDETGYGLLHLSTSRLQSRKLFSWGNNQGAAHWKEFLAGKAGNYIEIQAGLGKTQYGCLPMAPHTAWEWIERYGAFTLQKESAAASFEALQEQVTGQVLAEPAFCSLEDTLSGTKKMARTQAHVLYRGSGCGAMDRELRALQGKEPDSAYLDFGKCDAGQMKWINFLRDGRMWEPDAAEEPEEFVSEEPFFDKLKETIEDRNSRNWYAHYQLGNLYCIRASYPEALLHYRTSLRLKENAWAYHGIASVETLRENRQEAGEAMKRGLMLRSQDLSYVREGFRLLSLNQSFGVMRELLETLPASVKADGRIKLYEVTALYDAGRTKEAYELLCGQGGLVVDDIREGEASMGELWKKINRELFGEDGEIPYRFDFDSSGSFNLAGGELNKADSELHG